MAEENQDGQEKTEEPTQKRLDKAAEEGRVLTSKEVMVFSTLAIALVLYMGLLPFMGAVLKVWGSMFVIDSGLNLDTLGVAVTFVSLPLFSLTLGSYCSLTLLPLASFTVEA